MSRAGKRLYSIEYTKRTFICSKTDSLTDNIGSRMSR